PDPSFIPMIYPPGYSALMAAFGSIVGLDYWVGRLLSIVGTSAATGAIIFIVGRHGRDWLMGIFAGAAFLGCYEASGAFYDLVRPDGLYIGFLACSIALALEKRRGTAVAAGLLLAVAFMMKHNAAVFGIPIVVGLYARGGWRQALEFALASIVPALLFVGYMQLTSGGMFLEYLLGVPRSHPFKADRGFAGVPREAAMILPVAMSFIAFWLIVHGPKMAAKAPIGALVALPVAAGVLAGWAGVQLSQVKGMAMATHIQSFISFGTLGAAGMACLMVLLTALVTEMTWRRWLILAFLVSVLTPVITFVGPDWRWLPIAIAGIVVAALLTWLSRYLHWKWVFGVGIGLMALFMSCV
ncbi:MAG: hypothetical protein HN348_36085, partial [Proteobacteria bacterium]|nr:hypothetical protein [Pseudomonadota bacterium]